jgi:hypothetical protein
MNFNNEMNGIANYEIKSNSYINKPGIEEVVITKYELVNPDKGTPYLELTFQTADDNKLSLSQRFYRVKDGDSEESASFKLDRIKRVLINAGANFNLTGEEVLKSSLNNKFQVLFKQVEYIGYDKDNANKPIIKTKIEYSFSEPIGKEINGNQSYFYSKLRDRDQLKFDGELKNWERDNSSSQPTNNVINEESSTTTDDDLPF